MKTKETSFLMLVVIAKNGHYARYLGRDRSIHIIAEEALTEEEIQALRNYPAAFLIEQRKAE